MERTQNSNGLIWSPKVGDRVTSSGYPGIIRVLCTGQLKGMAEVQLERGSICVAFDQLKPIICGAVQE